MALLALGLVVIFGGDGAVSLFFQNGSSPSDQQPSFRSGDLQSVYFNEFELADLGLPERVDPAQIRYRADLDLDDFSPGCAAKDCILSIDDPEFVAPAEADEWLEGGDRVISIVAGASARAYPFGILNYHEVVNDRIADIPISVTYCPLCRSALVFNRPTHASRRLEFGVAGRLYKDNLILYDRQTGSYWSQIQARPIVGPLVGSGLTLQRRAMDIMQWATWRDQYPDGRVLARPTDGDALGGHERYSRPTVPSGAARGGGSSGSFLFAYSVDPYEDYAADPQARTEDFEDARLPPKAVVIGVELDVGSVAVPERSLSPGQTLELTVEGRGVTLLRDEKRRIRAFTSSGREQHELQVVTAYWFAWLSFHPNTVLYEDAS